MLSLDGYDTYFSVGNNGFTNGVQVLVSDRLYPQLTGIETYAELRPILSADADRGAFDEVLDQLCQRIPGSTVISYEQTDRQLTESFEQIRLLAWGLILFVALIGLLNIINTVYTNIHTRIAEIGMQRAIGMSAGSLFKVFLWGRGLLWLVRSRNRKFSRIYLHDFRRGGKDRQHSAGCRSHNSNRGGNCTFDWSLLVGNVHSVKKNQ